MGGYTKGEWKTYQDGVHPVLENGGNGNDSFAICQCFGPDKAFNARLISAAPDMYDALSGLLAAYEKPDNLICCNGRDCGCMGSTVHQQAEYHARAALAKAEGR